VTRIGALGCAWRASVNDWGRIDPDDMTPAVDWFIAAADRWHVPEHEQSRRQRRLDGTPVVETRIRVPGGDAVHVVAVLADGAGHTVIEVRNESPTPFAVAFTRADLVSSHAPTDAPRGADLPAGTVTFPVAHRSTRTVLLPHEPGRTRSARTRSLDSVVKGWCLQAGRGTRYDLPTHGEEIVAARCDVMLDGPLSFADPVDRLLAAGEWLRLGEDVAGIVESVARDASDVARAVATSPTQLHAWAMASAADVLRAAGEDGGARDAERWITNSEGRSTGSSPLAVVGELRARLVASSASGLTLLADPLPAWRYAPLAVHREPTRWGAVSYAVRWHGDRPALLWDIESDGNPLMTCGLDASWTTREPRGEALLEASVRS